MPATDDDPTTIPTARDLDPLSFDACEALGFDGTGRFGPAHHAATDHPVCSLRLPDGYRLVGVLVTDDQWEEANQ